MILIAPQQGGNKNSTRSVVRTKSSGPKVEDVDPAGEVIIKVEGGVLYHGFPIHGVFNDSIVREVSKTITV